MINDLSQNYSLVFVVYFVLVFVVYFDVQLSSFSRCAVLFRRAAKHFSISSFWIGFRPVFCRYFQVFSQMLSVVVKEWKFCCIRFRFVLWSKKLTRFCLFNFLDVSHTAKKKYNFLYSYKLYASSWAIFADISLTFARSFTEL